MILFLSLIFAVTATFMAAYLTRHYLFTLVTLYHKKEHLSFALQKTEYQPKVSILIPARNEEYVIDRILQSMTELTYPKEKMEVIVIDDASIDRTGEKAEKFAREYKFIKLVHRGPEVGGKGKSDVLNCGLKHASGELVYCFDADYCPQRNILEKLTACFRDLKLEPYKEGLLSLMSLTA